MSAELDGNEETVALPLVVAAAEGTSVCVTVDEERGESVNTDADADKVRCAEDDGRVVPEMGPV